MGGFDVGITAHFAKDGGAFDSFIANAVELAEQGGAFDFSHET
jgi:hypothetical protein